MLVRRHADIPGFVRSLHLHYSVRLHAAILLAAAGLAGLLLSWFLLWLGMETPMLRFPVAVVAAYAFFLLFVDWWLRYLGLKRTSVDEIHDPGIYPSGGSGSSHPSAPAEMHAGGGTFDGGGASAGFDDAGTQAIATKAEVAARGKVAMAHVALESKAQAGAAVGEAVSSSASLGEVASGAAGLAELALPIVIVVAILALFAGAAGWIITVTPTMLVETAVEVAIASGLIRSMSRTRQSTWFDSLFVRSIGKALLLATLAFVLGLIVRLIDPAADTLGQAIARLFSH